MKQFTLCTWLCTHICVAGVTAGLYPGGAGDAAWLLLPYSGVLKKMTWSVRVGDNHLMSPELLLTCGEELHVRSKVSALYTGNVSAAVSGMCICCWSHLSSSQQGVSGQDCSWNCIEKWNFWSKVQLSLYVFIAYCNGNITGKLRYPLFINKQCKQKTFVDTNINFFWLLYSFIVNVLSVEGAERCLMHFSLWFTSSIHTSAGCFAYLWKQWG